MQNDNEYIKIPVKYVVPFIIIVIWYMISDGKKMREANELCDSGDDSACEYLEYRYEMAEESRW